MNLFQSPGTRKLLFACLYLSEGAPIGFIWLALPTRLRAQGVPVDQITALAALLVLPWTFKFAWAPLIDFLRSERWTLRHWILAAQCLMGISLVPLLWIHPVAHFNLLASLLFVHALSAATQDVAIDALCISTTEPGERGEYNGWMQAGMLLGRALMGGGALVLMRELGEHGEQMVIGMLIFLTTFSMLLLLMSPPPEIAGVSHSDFDSSRRWETLARTAKLAVGSRNTWLGLLFAVIGGAGFKSMEVVLGPFLIDRGFEEQMIGWFSLGMIVTMILGAVLGGWLTDRVGPRRCVAFALVFIALTITGLAMTDRMTVDLPLAEGAVRWDLLVWLATASVGIGAFTASSYALFMDITHPAIAATQFSAFMGATNGCESWSSYIAGKIIIEYSYSTALLLMSAVSLIGLPVLAALRINLVVDPLKNPSLETKDG